MSVNWELLDSAGNTKSHLVHSIYILMTWWQTKLGYLLTCLSKFEFMHELETREMEIFVRIESRIESAAAIRIRIESRIE